MFQGTRNHFWLWQIWYLSVTEGVGQGWIWGSGGPPKPREQYGLRAGWVLRPHAVKGRLGP